MRKFFVVLAALALAACEVTTTTGPAPAPAPTGPVPDRIPVSRAKSNFDAVVNRVMPVAESQCRARTRNTNCNFLVVVDRNPRLPPNAFQTVDRNGRPVIGFTLSLIADARNQDELAFVLGHEAAHHIEGHIPKTEQRAVEGAILGTVVAAALGLDPAATEAAQRGGATVGARRFAKSFELEADRLGTIIAARAGYDPVKGARFFQRIPDPGDRFLGTHPPNADRIRTVQQTAAGL